MDKWKVCDQTMNQSEKILEIKDLCVEFKTVEGTVKAINHLNYTLNQRIIAENAQFTGIAAGQGVGFTTGLLHLRKGLGMRETPIRPHSWHCRMQSDYQYD